MLTDAEIEANRQQGASDSAGAYLEGIGKTDLITFTPKEWRGLIAAAIKGYHDTPPF